MDTQVKFSVIVPTRERADTLVHCLRTLVAQDYENLDIIVSDNFSQDGTKAAVSSFSDKRIRYLNTGKRVSMSHNWEFALDHVKAGWVMFLGDDDGLYPWALPTLDKSIRKYKVEALWSASASFLWPGHFEKWPKGGISIPLTDSVVLKQSKVELRRVFSGKGLSSGLPWLYAGGAASIELINRTRDENGHFFRSQNPDYYSAVALACATDKYLSIEIPIAVNGASKHSSGATYVNSIQNNDGGPVLTLKQESNIPFHDSLIAGESFQLLWYESYLQAQHIHKNFLGITLRDQLELALRVRTPGQIKAVWNQCNAIAAKHGLPISDKGIGLQYRLRRWSSLLRGVFFCISIEPKQLNIVNIYDAVMASGHVYLFLRSFLFAGKLALLLFNVKRVFLKIGNRALRGRIFATFSDM